MNNWWSLPDQTPQPKSDVIIEPGELIEISRRDHQHWAVYVGNGYVVHVTLPSCAEIPGAVSKSLRSVPTEDAMVRRDKLKDVVGDDKWKINYSLDKKYDPHSPCIIVEEALRQVGKRMKYSVTRNNCEHFATELRYGKHECRQVEEKLKELALIGAVMVSIVVVGGLIALALAVALVFLIRKYRD